MMWLLCSMPCPICGGDTEYERSGEEGTTYESDSRCKKCPWWFQSFSYGYNEEQIGFVWQDWSYDVPREEDLERVRVRNIALKEIKEAVANSEFRALCGPNANIGIIADWLADHEFFLQEEWARQYNSFPMEREL